MKKAIRFIAALLALSLAATFTACDNDEDEVPLFYSKSVTSTDYGNIEDGVGDAVSEYTYTATLTFTDGSFVLHKKGSVKYSGHTLSFDLDVLKGTYSGGDPYTDGQTVTLKITQSNDFAQDTTLLTKAKALIAASSETTFSVTNTEVPLTADVRDEESVTVSDLHITVDGISYLRSR